MPLETWVQLQPPCFFLGFLPYDLAPVCSEIPSPVRHPRTGEPTFAFTLDLRRVGDEALDRIVVESAFRAGILAEDVRAAIAKDAQSLGILMESVACAFQAENLETAGANAIAVRETGRLLAGNRSVEVMIGSVRIAANPTMGGAPRG